METIQYKLRQVTGSAASGKGRYKADMAKPQVVELDDFIEIMARSTRQSTIDARFAVNAVSETIQMLLNEGITVKLDLVKFKPSLKPAAFETVDADLLLPEIQMIRTKMERFIIHLKQMINHLN